MTRRWPRDRLSTNVYELRPLADYAATLYRRKLLEDSPLSADEKYRVAVIRQAVLKRELIMALDLLGQDIGFGDHHILFLRKAFPFLSDEEKSEYLVYAWQKLQSCGHQRLAIQLFREAAPGFKSTIPQSWPAAITVYRGAKVIDYDIKSHDWLWRFLKRNLRKGFSWTIKRESALWFAGQYDNPLLKKGLSFDAENYTDEGLAGGARIIGCLASATVSSQDVIAYFGAPEGDEPAFAYDEEDECVIAPDRISRVTYEEITAS